MRRYRAVVDNDRWPRSSWIVRTSVPDSSRCTAKAWRLYLSRYRRHATAMHMLQSGVHFEIIALWLGHESPNTTHRYVEANLAMKQQALDRLEAPTTKIRRFHPPDALLRFLQTV